MKLKQIKGKRIPIRLPLPPHAKIHSTEGGARDYGRSESKQMARKAMKGNYE